MSSSERIELSGFKQTYWRGHHDPIYAEPALGFPATQTPNAAIKALGGNTRNKLILCVVPDSAPASFDGKPNPYAGKIYAVVELFARDIKTSNLLKGYDRVDNATLKYWIDNWPRALPIRRWYGIKEKNQRRFIDLQADARKAAQTARGRLLTPDWLTSAANLAWEDVVMKDVYLTPALQNIQEQLDG